MIVLWSVLMFSAALKLTAVENFHWYATAAALPFLLVPRLARLVEAFPLRMLLAPLGLVLAVVISGFLAVDGMRPAVHAGKLTVILLLLYPLFLGAPDLARKAFCAAGIAVFLNVALILAGGSILPGLAWTEGAGRSSTVLNFPGSLARLGMVALGYALYKFSFTKTVSLSSLSLMAASLFLIFRDGSRTAMLGSVLAVAAFGAISLYRMVRSAQKRVFLAKGLCIAALLMAAQAAFDNAEASRGAEFTILSPRVASMVERLRAARTWEALHLEDQYRLEMIAQGWRAVLAHPVLGSGLGSNTALTQAESEDIHNSFVQAWADLGILGFVSYTCLVLGWIVQLRPALANLSRLRDAEDHAVYVGSMLVLMLHAFSGLFHPISVEITEWIMFIIPRALFHQIATGGAIRLRRPRPLAAQPAWALASR